MKIYLDIYKIYINNAISYLAQYRKDTWIQIAVFFAWVLMLMFTVDIIFTHTQQLGGWNKVQVYLMIIFWTISYELSTLIYRRSVKDIPHLVTDGDLDLLIIKPANSLFLITLKQIEPRSIVSILIQIGLATWVILNNAISVHVFAVFLTCIALICGLIVQYSVAVLANTLSFWLNRIDNVNDLTWNLKTLGRYPLDIFPSVGKFILLTIIPMGLLAYVPLLIFTGTWPMWYILFPIMVSVIFLSATVLFWNFAIKRYSSASS